MTPKEKAEEITNKFYQRVASTFHYGCSKVAAVISVEQIIDALSEYDNRNDTYELQNMGRDFNYWNKVKEEIEKL